MEEPNEHQQAKRLWRHYRSQVGSSGECPDALLLASFVDGRCPEQDVQGMEHHLALCSTCLETVTLLRDPTLRSSEVPSFVVEQGKSMVGQPASTPVRNQDASRGWSWEWGLQWTALAATCAVICVVGFNLGMAVQQTQMQVDQLVVSEMLFGLGDYVGGLSADTHSAMRGEL